MAVKASLRTEVLGLLDDAQQLCAGVKEAEKLQTEIVAMRTRLDQPLRVAVVGAIKAGKSTFMNALMGKSIVSVDTLEATYTVCWFKYADEPSLSVHFRNGELRQEPFDKLGWWSERRSGNPEIDEVKYLVINYPSEILKKIEFIDTPGLNSSYGTDSQNTLDFLAMRSSKETMDEASMADAVIYAFYRTLVGEDAGVLQTFSAGNTTNHSPLNSIGILTKADMMSDIFDWPDGSPTKGAQAVIDSNMANPAVKKLLYTIFPVCAKAVEGCSMLNEKDWEALRVISSTEHSMLIDALSDANFFVTDDEYMALGSTGVRKRLMDVLGQYGILELARQLHEGKTPEEAGDILAQRCGITDIKDVILSHFGNRTFIIKVEYVFNHLRSILDKYNRDPSTGQTLRNICGVINNRIDNIISDQQRIRELDVIRMYYNGRLRFRNESEKEDMLQITGEYGQNVEARLGAGIECSVSELKKIAVEKMRRWRYNHASSVMGDTDYNIAAGIIARSYEHVLSLLKQLDEI